MDKRNKTVLNGFIGIVNESKRKPKLWVKLWADKGKEFCNKLTEKWLGDNHILMGSIYNERKSVLAERFIRPLKGKQQILSWLFG